MHSGYRQVDGGGEVPAIEVRSRSESPKGKAGLEGYMSQEAQWLGTARFDDRPT